jgi:ketosteroid isomerase-like protein
VVRQAYRFFGSAWEEAQRQGAISDLDLTDLYDPEVVLDEIADFPGAQAYRGYDGLTRWFADWYELYDEMRIDPGSFEEAGDRVIVPTRQWFRSRAGVETEQEIVHVWTLRNGRVIHVTGFRDMADARARAGLDRGPHLSKPDGVSKPS